MRFSNPVDKYLKSGLLLLSVMLPWMSHATVIEFESIAYTVAPGDQVEVVTLLSDPIPQGLEGYALKLEFPQEAVTLSTGDISVPAELDFGLLDPGADKNVGQGFASVAGYVELGQPAYSGTGFVSFTLTIPSNALTGAYELKLSKLLPIGVNFVDGAGNPIDGDIQLGSTTLYVAEGRPPESLDDLSIKIVNGQTHISFTGLPGWNYSLFRTDDPATGWVPVDSMRAPSDGKMVFIRPFDSNGPLQFYTIGPAD